MQIALAGEAVRESSNGPYVLIDYSRPLRGLFAEHGISVFNGLVCEESHFPRPSDGKVAIIPAVERFDYEMRVDSACQSMRHKLGDALAGVWELAACRHLLKGEDKLYAFGATVRLDDVDFYPYLGCSARACYVSLTRSDFFIQQGALALAVKQKVLVR